MTAPFLYTELMEFDKELDEGLHEKRLEEQGFEKEVDEILLADYRALDALIMSKVDLPKIRAGVDWFNKKTESEGSPKLECKGLWSEEKQSHMTDRIIEGQSYKTYIYMITSDWKESTPYNEKRRYIEFSTQNTHPKIQLTLTRKLLEEDMVNYKQGYDFTTEYEEKVISLKEFWVTYKQWLIDGVDN